MKIRRFIFIFTAFIITVPQTFAETEPEYFRLPAEPLIRIGLSTNSGSVSITTSDSSLVSVSPDEQSKLLATTKVTVSARA